MASGCAVIATLRGGIPEFCGIGDEAGAILVEPEVEAFTEQLRRLATDAELLKTWKQRAIQRSAGMSWERNAVAFEQLALRLQK
jgi:glycosyltransferase involved in cell wall biosynthesis